MKKSVKKILIADANKEFYGIIGDILSDKHLISRRENLIQDDKRKTKDNAGIHGKRSHVLP